MFATLPKFFAAILTLCVFMVVGASVAVANPSQAQGTAGITILESLEVAEQQPMHFGYVHRPSEGTNTLVLGYNDDSVITQGSGDAQYVDGTSSSGMYLVSGAPEQSIQLSVFADDFEDSSIVLEDTFIQGQDSEAVAQLDDAGQFLAGIGGVITIDSDAPVGDHTTDVYVTVEYE